MKDADRLKTPEAAPDTTTEIFPDPLFQETFLARALVRSDVSRLLLETQVGQLLIRNGLVTHPVISERDRQKHRLQDLTIAYEKTGLFPRGMDLQKKALQEPDMQPILPPSSAEIEKQMQEWTNQFIDQLGINIFEHVPTITFENAPFKQEIVNKQIYCALRDKIFDLAAHRDWQILINLVRKLHAAPNLQEPLTALLRLIGPKLFQRADFRRQLTEEMITRIMLSDFDGHEELALFFVDLGFPEISETEKALYLSPEYLNHRLEKSWRSDQVEYFRIVQKLFELNIITDQFLRENSLFRLHIMEFSLKALLRNTNFETFAQKVKPLVIAWGIFSEDELSLRNHRALFTEYQKLCLSQNIKINHEIAKLFRRGDRDREKEE